MWLAHRLSCPEACGVTPDQGLTPWSLPWRADSQPQDCQGSPCDDTRYPLWDLEGDLLLRFTQLGAGAAEGWESGGLDRQEGCEKQRGPGKTLRGEHKAARRWGAEAFSPSKASKPDWARGFHLYPRGPTMALRLSRGSCLAHASFPAWGRLLSHRSGQRVSSTRTALRPGKGRLRALLQAQRREQVTGDVGSILVREAKPSGEFRPGHQRLGKPGAATLPSLGLRVPIGKTSWLTLTGASQMGPPPHRQLLQTKQ